MKKATRDTWNLFQYGSVGCLIVSVISIVQLTGVDKPAYPINFAIHFFAISIPLLAGFIVLNELLKIGLLEGSKKLHHFLVFLMVAGCALSVCGVGILFEKHSTFDAYLFLGFSFFIIFLTSILLIVKINETSKREQYVRDKVIEKNDEK